VSSKFNDIVSRRPTSNVIRENSSTRSLTGAMEVLVELLEPNTQQIRTEFNEVELKELAADIKERGILQPLIVRGGSEGKYQIIAGERRYRAAKLAGLKRVPVVLKEMADKEARMAQLIENIQRTNLSDQDEQRFYLELQNEYNLSVQKIADMVHKSRGYVRNRLEGKLDTLQADSEKNNNMASQANSYNDLQTADSEKNNNMASQANSSTNELKKTFNFKLFPKTFVRFGQTLEDALVNLKEQKPDKQTRKDLLDNLERVKQKLAELEAKLASLPDK
jgi:ParB family chromosome partitioning protein